MRAGLSGGMTSLLCVMALVGFGPRALARPAEDSAEREAVEPSARQALVGHWTLNSDLSEDPREKLREAMQKGTQGGGMGGGGGMRGGGMGGGGMGRGGMGRGGGTGRSGGGMGPGGREEGRQTPMMTFFSARELTITHLEPAVAIVEPDGRVRTLQPDGEKYQTEHEGEVKTRWKGDTLVVETTTDRGQMTESWSVSPEPGRLTVVLEIQPGGGRMPPVKVNRVYDRLPLDR